MTRAEREKLIEEKNRVLGQQKESVLSNISVKRKSLFNLSTRSQDKNEVMESSLTEAEQALLKVCSSLNENLSNVILGEVFRNCRRIENQKAPPIFG